MSFFASLRQIVGGRDFDVSLPADATVHDLVDELAAALARAAPAPLYR